MKKTIYKDCPMCGYVSYSGNTEFCPECLEEDNTYIPMEDYFYEPNRKVKKVDIGD